MIRIIPSRASRLILFSCIALVCAFGQNRSWPDYGGGPDNSHFVESKIITRANIDKLDVAWSYPYGQTGFNPVIVGKTMYVIGRGALIALDAVTGKELWIHEGLQGIHPRGINYWQSKDGKDRRLIFSLNSYLQEIDATTGKSILNFGKDGAVNLREGLGRDPLKISTIQSNSPGKIFENLVLIGSVTGEGFVSPPGDLRAFDVVTGKQVWQFHTVPHPGEFGYDTFPKDAWKYIGGNNTWGDMSVDEKRGIAYFPLGSATYDFYGADRKGDNLYGNTLLALDARTGKRLWHFQAIHHDLWDYDLAAAPQLTTIKQNGKSIDVVAQAGKNGFLYVFDRVTGKPIWPIVEKPVPQSDVPGEHSSPTQPIPTAPPPFVVQSFSVDDINPYLAADERAFIRDQVLSARNDGMYTPPSLKGSIQMPQNSGGANWGVTAANPTNGTVYVLGNNAPALLRLEKLVPTGRPGGPNASLGRGGRGGPAVNQAAAGGRALYLVHCQSCHGADLGGGSGPMLTTVGAKLDAKAIDSVIRAGKGFMPAFATLPDVQIESMVAYLRDPAAGAGRGGRGGPAPQGPLTWMGGTVVESGPVPAARVPAPVVPGESRALYGGNAGTLAYPEGVDVPQDRYGSGYGLGGSASKPPFSTLTAYDLNKGTIKWQIPAGDDPILAAQGIHNTGARGLRVGIVSTVTGIVFMVGGDNKLHAFAEADGKEIWTHAIAGTSGGSPSMYEIDGKQFLVITVSGPGAGGRGGQAPQPVDEKLASLPSGYVVFALGGK